MKQHITTKQLEELSDKGIEKLQKWWVAKEGDKFRNVLDEEYVVTKETHAYMIGKKFKNGYPLLSIGQMIEFLADNEVIDEEFIYCQWELNNNCPSWVVNSNGKEFRSKELRTALREACKEVLNET